ncbi:MAG: AMP-binding protein [Lachnospiraceae bacterium]|nr:AMP-binding protein [Lachnospiraceae bacterium]
MSVIPLENITIGGLLRRSAARYPERPALQQRGGILSYREMDEAVDLAARRLMKWGVRTGTHIAIRAEAHQETIIAMYALLRIGAVVIMINTSLIAPEVENLLVRTDAEGMLIGDGYKTLIYAADSAPLLGVLPLGIKYIGMDGAQGSFDKLSDTEPAEEPLLAGAEAAVDPQDIAYILFTSGTSSNPKSVVTTHYSFANSGIQQASDQQATCEDKFCVAMPIFHCFCMSVNVLSSCAVGACLYLPDTRRTGELLRAVSERRCTVLSSVGALFHAMLSRSDFEQWDLSSLRTGFIGGSSYPPEFFKEIEKRFGFTLLSSLGQTEATAGITTACMDDPLEVRATTVGHLMSHIEGRTVDGELCIRGYNVMKEYYRCPGPTAEAIDEEGWLHTGDMGYFDEAGNFHLTGRKKELVIRGGENISPAEIDALFFGDRRFRYVKTVGVPDPHYGEELCLCLEMAEGGVSEVELRDYMKEHLADFKIPRYILIIEGFPVTSTGKVITSKLKEIALSMLGLEQ